MKQFFFYLDFILLIHERINLHNIRIFIFYKDLALKL